MADRTPSLNAYGITRSKPAKRPKPTDAYSGQGGISSFVSNYERALRNEAAQEAELVRQRQQQLSAMRAAAPQMPTPEPMTLEQYISNARGNVPLKEAPEFAYINPESSLSYVPSWTSALEYFGLRTPPKPDAQIDARLGRISGNMAMNNQRVRQRLDDFERERARALMLRSGK